MSVAFRRESDDEHKEPTFEWPIPPGPNLVTPRGLRLLGEGVAALDAAIEAETDAEAKAKLQRQLRYLGTRKATAEVQAPAKDAVVGIGSRVRYTLTAPSVPSPSSGMMRPIRPQGASPSPRRSAAP